jgi:hypothetical protein
MFWVCSFGQRRELMEGIFDQIGTLEPGSALKNFQVELPPM